MRGPHTINTVVYRSKCCRQAVFARNQITDQSLWFRKGFSGKLCGNRNLFISSVLKKMEFCPDKPTLGQNTAKKRSVLNKLDILAELNYTLMCYFSEHFVRSGLPYRADVTHSRSSCGSSENQGMCAVWSFSPTPRALLKRCEAVVGFPGSVLVFDRSLS